ncbi:hypothetical protein DB88DRAFT_478891 [Papiliotrema laurentii]|uniref:COX assembly mitochondrial protein n=1 Tax=Papiliotrema laurentii TaxID=5418 RepID=A0AAD9FX91_PAPLA|nr:hypothetical protein DB88DRAFT_478891 [Papiliotrema laurentii]
MQALSRREENEVMDQAKAEATAACQDTIKAFAQCAEGRTFSMGWTCKDHLRAMRSCMREAVPESRIDEIKLDYIKHRDERRVQALETQRKERIEAMKRHAGIKDDPTSIPVPSPAQTPTPASEPVWSGEAPGAGYGR